MSAFRYDNSISNCIGVAISGCQIYVCTQPATTNVIPPSPLAVLYTDSTGSTPAPNPVTADGNGNYFFYAATGTYTIVLYDPEGRIPTQVFPDQEVVSPGGGTVTSIALTMPAEFSVSGSPVTTSGTFAVTKANQNANLVYAGPASGPAAAPTFRALVAADVSGLGLGTVTSVALTLTGSALLSLGVTGSPITTAGTLALTVNFANQAKNTFLAGPVSGSAGAVTARLIVPADLPGGTAVASAASMTFDASVNSSFRVLMGTNVTSSAISNPTARQVITFIIAENATGGFTFAWPSNVRGASNIQTDANGVNVQSFIYDEVTSQWRAIGPGSWNAS